MFLAGWQPQHLAVRSSKGSAELIAAVPLYVKYHSMGEFIFDQVRKQCRPFLACLSSFLAPLPNDPKCLAATFL